MERRHPFAMPQGMEGGDVAETDEPFAKMLSADNIKILNKMHRTVAAARAEDSPDLRVEDSLAEVGKTPFAVGAERAVLASSMRHHPHAKALANELSGSAVDQLRRDFRGRRHNGDKVAHGERRGEDRSTAGMQKCGHIRFS